jgi:hypothetical protein
VQLLSPLKEKPGRFSPGLKHSFLPTQYITRVKPWRVSAAVSFRSASVAFHAVHVSISVAAEVSVSYARIATLSRAMWLQRSFRAF